GEKYAVKEDAWYSIAGTYNLIVNTIAGPQALTLDVKSTNSASLILGKDTLTPRFSYDGKSVKIGYSASMRARRGAGMPNNANM
ncbi:hypothetical protein ABTE52_21720, partial [Acinetobacter baumannii]